MFDAEKEARAAGACFRGCYNLLMLLPSSNELLVSASEPRISIYGGCNVVLAPFAGLEVGFHSYKFLNPV
jgi:hypothetical protein